jgi:hypothetical protein
MRLIPFGLLSFQLLAAGSVAAQTVNDLRIVVAGFAAGVNGGEKAVDVPLTAEPIAGKQTSGVFSMVGCGGFSVRPAPNPFANNAAAGWTVEITPTRIVDHAVTFRLRWVRALDRAKGSSPTSGDVELTLRPGEARPLDSVTVAPDVKTPDGRRCETDTASLRVSVDYPTLDRRLIGAEVWLVERLPNGTERSQSQSVRGLPHRSVPFYFDRILDMNVDIFGHLVVEPGQGDIEIALETVRAWHNPSDNISPGYQSARWLRSTLHVKPDEVVEVPLPKLDEKGAQNFSLRIRARQIR